MNESLKYAYYNSDDIKNIQNEFINDIEAFPRALAGLMPKISSNISRSDKKNKNYTAKAPSHRNRELSKSFSITQPIFAGGGGVAGLKSAQLGFRAARSNYYLNEQKIILKAIKTYLNCYEAKEKYEITQTSYDTNVKQLAAVEERLNVGETTITEKASAIAAVAIALSRKLEAYAALQTAKADFVRIFGIEAVDITLPNDKIDLPRSFEELNAKAQSNSFDIEALKHATASSKANEITATSAILPQVNFNVSGGDVTTNQDRTRSSNKANSLTSSVSVNIPILSNGGVEYSDIRKTKNYTRKLAIQLESRVKEVHSACINSWENFNAQKASTKASSEGIVAAQIAYDGMLQEEILGSKTILEVLTALEKLNEAKIRNVEASVKYIISVYEIKALISELTAQRLQLPVEYFSPEMEFKKNKFKIIGF